jgi:hypothetical protein
MYEEMKKFKINNSLDLLTLRFNLNSTESSALGFY